MEALPTGPTSLGLGSAVAAATRTAAAARTRIAAAGTKIATVGTRTAAVTRLHWWLWQLQGESWKWGGVSVFYDLGMKGKWWGVGSLLLFVFRKKEKKWPNDTVLI